MIRSSTSERTFYIKHTLRVAFDVPVFCEPTLVRLYPRLDGAGAVRWTKLEVTPRACQRRISHDEHGNTHWQLSFQDLTVSLTFTVTSCVELFGEPAESEHHEHWNADALVPYTHVQRKQRGPIEALVQDALRNSGGCQLEYLRQLTSELSNRVTMPRYHRFRSANTLASTNGDDLIGSRPDSVAVDDYVDPRIDAAATECLANAGRAQGIPARIVRGYDVAGIDEIESKLRTWVEFYLEDLGWVGFDLRSGQLKHAQRISLAKGATLDETLALEGIFRGSARLPESSTQIVIRHAAVATAH